MMIALLTTRAAGYWAALCCALISQPGLSQASSSLVPAEKGRAFEVVSIRPSSPAGGMGVEIRRTANGYIAPNQQLIYTIGLAYLRQLGNWTRAKSQVVGGPSWLEHKYDIQARISDADLAEWQKQGDRPGNEPLLLEMLRTMLAERFKFRAHVVQAPGEGFNLNLAKGGLKMTPESSFDPSRSEGRVQRYFDDGGTLEMEPEGGPQNNGLTVAHSVFYNASIADLALQLMAYCNCALQDHTGLGGRYNFVFYLPGELPDADDNIHLPFPYNSSLAKLGLRADPAKVPTQKLMIDHIERPSAN